MHFGIPAPKAENAIRRGGWRFCCPALDTGLPNLVVDDGFSIVPTADCPGRSFPFFRAALFADALAGRLLSLGWPDDSPAAGTSLAL
jgi:hypothetical protein